MISSFILILLDHQEPFQGQNKGNRKGVDIDVAAGNGTMIQTLISVGKPSINILYIVSAVTLNEKTNESFFNVRPIIKGTINFKLKVDSTLDYQLLLSHNIEIRKRNNLMVTCRRSNNRLCSCEIMINGIRIHNLLLYTYVRTHLYATIFYLYILEMVI